MKRIDRVLFRRWSGEPRTIIAILPDVPSSLGMAMMYEHIGQHGEGDYALVLPRTIPALPEEYGGLKKELEQIGYKLRVIKRLNKRR